jgi:hypothetical protein
VTAWLWLAACTGKDDGKGPGDDALEQDPVAVLESFAFGWSFFNHRLSHLEVHAEPDGARVSIIGGTSTTREVPPELPAACVSACDEFPFFDESEVDVGVRVLTSETVALVPAEVTLLAGRDGAEGVLRAELPEGVRGPGAALLSGFVIDTDQPLSGGDECYEPRFGWHPSNLRLALGEVTVADGVAEVPVSVAFAAGNTHDPDRVCIDEVNDRAQVSFTVSAVVMVGPGVTSADVRYDVAEEYAFTGVSSDPGEQVPPPDTTLGWGLDDDVVASGVSGFDWTFYPDVFGAGADEQGAYLRTLAFGAEPGGTARATATNYSPGTQLEGFSYAVDATARGVVLDADGEGFTVSGTLETELLDGAPVVHELLR